MQLENLDYTFLELLGNGDPFLRRNFIGGSDAPIIMGVSPWRKPIDLYREKKGLIEPQADNEHMAWGRANEDKARLQFEKNSNLKVPAKRVFCKKYPWRMASFDGLDETGKEGLEIKCPGRKAHEIALFGKVPDYYYPQLQHAMHVQGLEYMHYFSWFDENNYVSLVVKFDEDYAKILLEKEIEFWNCLTNDIEPDTDYEERIEDEWKELRDSWSRIQNEKKALSVLEDGLKERIITAAHGKNSKGYGMVAKKIARKGNVDYSLIPELQGVDVEQFRKDGSEFWQISLSGGNQ